MPIYDYICKDCHHEMEVLQKIGDSELKDCPACHNPSLVRQVSAPSVRLSGQGYYETDEKPKDKQRHIATKDSEK